MCDPRQGSTLAGQPRKTTCRAACAVGSTYSTGGSATCLYQLRTHTPTPTPTPTPTLALAQTHARTHARTHTRQDGSRRTQDLGSSHLSAAERSVHQVEQSGARTARSWNKHTPLPQLPSPTSGPESIHRSSPIMADRPWPVARSLISSHMARWPRRPSLMLQPAASGGHSRY